MIGRLLALVIGLSLALAFSQAPEFAQQYRQRLGGAVDELARIVGAFDANAAANGLSRQEGILRLELQPDPVARSQGVIMHGAADRLARLQRQQAAFATAGPFLRIAELAREPDAELLHGTYLAFEPAWPATTEGLASAGIGFALGWLLVFMPVRWGRRLVGAVGRRRARVRAPHLRSV